MCSFCIIEGPDTVQDFVQMQMQDIQDNIRSRRNKIFLLMEEVNFLEFPNGLSEHGFRPPYWSESEPLSNGSYTDLKCCIVPFYHLLVLK